MLSGLIMNDPMAITTTHNNLAVSSSLARRNETNDRVEPVTVKVLEPKLLAGSKPTNYIELIFTFILVSLGALTFMSYTLSLSFDSPQVERSQVDRL